MIDSRRWAAIRGGPRRSPLDRELVRPVRSRAVKRGAVPASRRAARLPDEGHGAAEARHTPPAINRQIARSCLERQFRANSGLFGVSTLDVNLMPARRTKPVARPTDGGSGVWAVLG